MQNKPRFVRYSLVTVSVTFLTSVAVLSATGQPIASEPVVQASLLSDSIVPYSSSIVSPNFTTPNQASAESIINFQAKADEYEKIYGNVTVPDPASAANSNVETSGTEAHILAVNTTDTDKTMVSVETPASYRFVNANELNVRSGAGTNFDRISTLERKEKVGVVSINGDWARIQTSSGVTGYALTQYLVSKESEVEPEEPAAYWYVNADTLNVRSGAGSDYDKVTTLSRGNKVGYFDESAGWARIQTTSGKEGYVLAKYMVDKKSGISWPSEDAGSVSRGSSSVTGDVSDLVKQITEYSTNFQGVKYVYGGSSPKGFDCSGFVQYVFAHFGINLPRSSEEYASFGTKVSRQDLKPGDILLFDTNHNGGVGHVGIYLGNDKFIHASTHKGKVIIMSLSTYAGDYYGARRVIK